jgi:hypothetical protein
VFGGGVSGEIERELDWLRDDNRAGFSDGKDECTPAFRNRAADGYPERVLVAALKFRLAETLGARRSRDGVEEGTACNGDFTSAIVLR